MTKQRVLIVDDEPDIRELLEITLLRMGLDTRSAEDYSQATRFLQEDSFDLCLTDMKLPDGDGIALVEHIQQNCPNIPTAVITAHGSIDLAIKAMKCGAFDFVSKPVSLETLRNLVDKALTLPGPAQVAEQAVDEKYQIIGESAPMLELKKSDRQVCPQPGAGFHQRRVRYRQGAGGKAKSTNRDRGLRRRSSPSTAVLSRRN